MTDRLHVFVQGRVQGVGFRYSAAGHAVSLGVAGWIRNLPDGRVEAEFEGPAAALEAMLDWCHIGPRFALVSHVDAVWEKGEPRHEGFHCRG